MVMIKNEGLGKDNQKVYDLNAIGLGAEPVDWANWINHLMEPVEEVSTE